MVLKVVEIIELDPNCSELEIPLYQSSIKAGFPSPADEYIECKLDLNKFIIKNAIATYFLKVSGDSMIGAGIFSNDILVVDRSIQATEGKIVIAELDGDLTVKRLEKIKNKLYLTAENDEYPAIPIGDEQSLQIWGVVTWVLHKPS